MRRIHARRERRADAGKRELTGSRLDVTSPDETGGRGLLDADLLARWLDEANDDAGASSVAVFIRYREVVRTELEQVGGLSPLDAVQKVGTVFHRAQEARADLAELPLRERLITVAREVAGLSNETVREE